MKILIISQEYPPRTGGAGVVAKQNAEGLASLGHEVTVLTRAWSTNNESEKVTVIGVDGIKKLWQLQMGLKLRKLILKNFDTVIINDIGAAYVFTTFLNYKKYIHKSVVYLHGGEVEKLLLNPRGYLKWTGFNKRYLSLIQLCKKVIAVSNYMKTYFLDNFPMALDERKLEVIYAGVDCNVFRPIESNIRAQLGIKSEEVALITVARVVKEKGFPVMLELFTEALKKDPSLHWIIIGDGPYLSTLKEKIKKLSLHNKVYLLGRIEQKKLPEYYSAADLFWLLSSRESFGLVYVEAQSCGCPALGFKHQGVVEAIQHDCTGYLVKGNSECLRILTTRDFDKFSRNYIYEGSRVFCSINNIRKLINIL